MKRISLLCFVFFAMYGSSLAQSDLPIFKPGTIYLGFSPGMSSLVENSGWPDYNKYRSYVIGIAPNVGVFLSAGLQVGVKGEYIGRFSNYAEFPAIFGAGSYLRYHPWPKGLHMQVQNSARSKKKMNFWYTPFIELDHTIRNASITKEEVSPTQNKLFANELAFRFGGTFRLGKNFFLSISPSWYYNFEAKEFSGWFPAANSRFEFYFNRRRPEDDFRFLEKKSPEEMAVILPQKDTSRSRMWGNLILGSSLTYIWDPAYTSLNSTETHRYEEFTWAVNLATDLSRRVRVGVDHKSLFTRSELSGENHYSMTGVFTQFNLLPRKRTRLFLSAMLYNGNYCSCDPDDPYLRKNLFYYGLGWGVDIRLMRGLYLDLAWENMNIFNNVHGKYNYTQYIIGLDFYLWEKKLPK